MISSGMMSLASKMDLRQSGVINGLVRQSTLCVSSSVWTSQPPSLPCSALKTLLLPLNACVEKSPAPKDKLALRGLALQDSVGMRSFLGNANVAATPALMDKLVKMKNVWDVELDGLNWIQVINLCGNQY